MERMDKRTSVRDGPSYQPHFKIFCQELSSLECSAASGFNEIVFVQTEAPATSHPNTPHRLAYVRQIVRYQVDGL